MDRRIKGQSEVNTFITSMNNSKAALTSTAQINTFTLPKADDGDDDYGDNDNKVDVDFLGDDDNDNGNDDDYGDDYNTLDNNIDRCRQL